MAFEHDEKPSQTSFADPRERAFFFSEKSGGGRKCVEVWREQEMLTTHHGFWSLKD